MPNSSPVQTSSHRLSETSTAVNLAPKDKPNLEKDHKKNDKILSSSESGENTKDSEDKKESKDYKTAHKSNISGLSERKLRKRRINLNELSSNLTCPKVCQFSNCGIQLPNSDALEWHYEGHFSQELEKLDKLKVKKPNPSSTASRESLVVRRPLRNSVVDRIRFNREKRLARKSLLR